MTFDELWAQVKGLPETAMIQVPLVLKVSTKKKIGRKTPEEVAAIVAVAIDEINHGSITPLDELINSRLYPTSEWLCRARLL